MRNLPNTRNSSAPNCLSEVTGPENNSKAKLKARTSNHSAKILLRLAILVDGARRRYAPIAWQGDALGGHHRKGVLQFSRGLAIRTFRWEVE